MNKQHAHVNEETDACLHHAFWTQVDTHPHRIAVEYDNIRWSYAALARCVNHTASLMAAQGVSRGDVVVINGARCPLLIVAMLAAAQLKSVFHVLGETNPPQYSKRVLTSVNHCYLVHARDDNSAQQVLEQQLAEKTSGILRLSLADMCSIADDKRNPIQPVKDESDAGDTVYLSATSGSTGTPKLVMGSHRPVTHFIRWYISAFSISHTDRFALLSGLGYDPMLRDILVPLSVGAALCIPHQKNLSSKNGIIKWLAQAGSTVIHLTPALSKIIFLPGHNTLLPTLRLAALGGEVVQQNVVEQIASAASNCKIINVYGTTETPQVMLYQTMMPLSDDQTTADRDSILLGKPIDGVDVLIVDDEGNEVAQGGIGEICLQTPYLYEGYLAPMVSSKLSALTPVGERYLTGDIGKQDEAGRILFLGRKDRQVKYRGHRVNLEMIESVIGQFPAVEHCAVSFPAGQSEKLICYYQASHGHENNEGPLQKWVNEALPSFMHPLQYIALKAMPMTASGKIDRQKLCEVDVHTPVVRPVATGECRASIRKVQDIWSQLLEIPTQNLALTDNFFEMGGNSLLATRLIDELNAAFGRKIEVTDLFLHSNVKALAGFLTSVESVKPTEVITPSNIERRQMRQRRIGAMQHRRRHITN